MTESVTQKGHDMIRRDEMKQIIESEIFKGFLSPQAAMLQTDIRKMGTYTGMALSSPAIKTQAVPVFNLDIAYENIKNSESTAIAAQKLADMINDFVRHIPNAEIDLSEIEDIMSSYETAKERLYMEAVSYKYDNPDVLVYEHLDIKFVPKILLSDNRASRYVIPVQKYWIDEMGITQEELFKDAINNTANILKPSIRSINGILYDYDGINRSVGQQILVITDERKMDGASLILSDTVLQKAADIYEGNYYILPSSTHEIITVPVDNIADETSSTINILSEMVAEVNETMREDEILSYNVYHYDIKEHKLEKATDYCINKQLDSIRNLRNEELKKISRDEPDSTPKM